MFKNAPKVKRTLEQISDACGPQPQDQTSKNLPQKKLKKAAVVYGQLKEELDSELESKSKVLSKDKSEDKKVKSYSKATALDRP